MTSSLKRINKELQLQYSDPIIKIQPINNDIYNLEAIIKGPLDTAYEEGKFFLNINIPKNYPFHPPKINFKTKIYHCNINSNGKISIDILSHNWSPAQTIIKLLLSITSLLSDP